MPDFNLLKRMVLLIMISVVAMALAGQAQAQGSPDSVWQPPAPSRAFTEECLAYLRSTGRLNDPNINPNALIQQCEQFFGGDVDVE